MCHSNDFWNAFELYVTISFLLVENEGKLQNGCFCPCEIPFSNQLYCLRVQFLTSVSQCKLMLPGFCPLPNWATLFFSQLCRASNISVCFISLKQLTKYFVVVVNKGWVCITLGSIYCLYKQKREWAGVEEWQFNRARYNTWSSMALIWWWDAIVKKRGCYGSCLCYISSAGY